MNSPSERWVDKYLRLICRLHKACERQTKVNTALIAIAWGRWWDQKEDPRWQVVNGELVRT